MTQTEREALTALQGSTGFLVLENLVKLKIADLDSVSNLDSKSQTAIGLQALANQKSVKLLKEFLSDLGFTFPSKGNDHTYE